MSSARERPEWEDERTGRRLDSRRRQHVPGRPRTIRLAVAALRLVAQSGPKGFALAVALQLLGALAAAALVISAQLTLAAVLRAEPALRDMLVPLGVLALASTIGSAVSGWQRQQQRLIGEDAGTLAWTRLLHVTSRVELRDIESAAFVDRVDRIQEHALGQPTQIADAGLGLLGSSASLLAMALAVLTMEPLLLPVLLLAAGPTIVLSRLASRSEFAFYQRWGELARRREYVRDLLSQQDYAQEVRAFAYQPELERRHAGLSRQYRLVLREQVRTRQIISLLGAAVSALALAATLGLVAWLIASRRMSLAEAGAAVVAVRLLAGQLDRFFAAVGSVVEASPFLADLEDLLQRTPLAGPAPTQAWPLAKGLQLRGIRFRYQGGGPDVLRGVDLDVGRGQVIALVGENGSGKSTLAKIAAGLYGPGAGTVSWDGRPVDELTRPGLRRSVATLFQDFVEYDLTAAENVQLQVGRSDDERVAARLQVERAAEIAGLAASIRSLPQGFDTLLGRQFSGGHELSGGQWQRLALARAVARDCPLVVLDEPTSALDPRAEQALFRTLRTAFAGRAVLLVSHRYAHLHLADHIYVLQDGTVVEQGTHSNLLARGGLYAELYRLQSHGPQGTR